MREKQHPAAAVTIGSSSLRGIANPAAACSCSLISSRRPPRSQHQLTKVPQGLLSTCQHASTLTPGQQQQQQGMASSSLHSAAAHAVCCRAACPCNLHPCSVHEVNNMSRPGTRVAVKRVDWSNHEQRRSVAKVNCITLQRMRLSGSRQARAPASPAKQHSSSNLWEQPPGACKQRLCV